MPGQPTAMDGRAVESSWAAPQELKNALQVLSTHAAVFLRRVLIEKHGGDGDGRAGVNAGDANVKRIALLFTRKYVELRLEKIAGGRCMSGKLHRTLDIVALLDLRQTGNAEIHVGCKDCGTDFLLLASGRTLKDVYRMTRGRPQRMSVDAELRPCIAALARAVEACERDPRLSPQERDRFLILLKNGRPCAPVRTIKSEDCLPRDERHELYAALGRAMHAYAPEGKGVDRHIGLLRKRGLPPGLLETLLGSEFFFTFDDRAVPDLEELARGKRWHMLPGVDASGGRAAIPGGPAWRGLFIPAMDAQQRVLAGQVKPFASTAGPALNVPKYSTCGASKRMPCFLLPELDMSPPNFVWVPETLPGDRRPWLGLTEGGLKSATTAAYFQIPVFGAGIGCGGDFCASLPFFRDAFRSLQARFGTKHVVFFPDAGCFENAQVARRNAETLLLFRDELGVEPSVAWWPWLCSADADAAGQRNIDDFLAKVVNFRGVQLISAGSFWATHEAAARDPNLGDELRRRRLEAWEAVVAAVPSEAQRTRNVAPPAPWLLRVYEPMAEGAEGALTVCEVFPEGAPPPIQHREPPRRRPPASGSGDLLVESSAPPPAPPLAPVTAPTVITHVAIHHTPPPNGWHPQGPAPDQSGVSVAAWQQQPYSAPAQPAPMEAQRWEPQPPAQYTSGSSSGSSVSSGGSSSSAPAAGQPAGAGAARQPAHRRVSVPLAYGDDGEPRGGGGGRSRAGPSGLGRRAGAPPEHPQASKRSCPQALSEAEQIERALRASLKEKEALERRRAAEADEAEAFGDLEEELERAKRESLREAEEQARRRAEGADDAEMEQLSAVLSESERLHREEQERLAAQAAGEEEAEVELAKEKSALAAVEEAEVREALRLSQVPERLRRAVEAQLGRRAPAGPEAYLDLDDLRDGGGGGGGGGGSSDEEAGPTRTARSRPGAARTPPRGPAPAPASASAGSPPRPPLSPTGRRRRCPPRRTPSRRSRAGRGRRRRGAAQGADYAMIRLEAAQRIMERQGWHPGEPLGRRDRPDALGPGDVVPVAEHVAGQLDRRGVGVPGPLVRAQPAPPPSPRALSPFHPAALAPPHGTGPGFAPVAAANAAAAVPHGAGAAGCRHPAQCCARLHALEAPFVALDAAVRWAAVLAMQAEVEAALRWLLFAAWLAHPPARPPPRPPPRPRLPCRTPARPAPRSDRPSRVPPSISGPIEPPQGASSYPPPAAPSYPRQRPHRTPSSGFIVPPANGLIVPPSSGLIVPPSSGPIVPSARGPIVPLARDLIVPPARGLIVPPARGRCLFSSGAEERGTLYAHEVIFDPPICAYPKDYLGGRAFRTYHLLTREPLEAPLEALPVERGPPRRVTLRPLGPVELGARELAAVRRLNAMFDARLPADKKDPNYGYMPRHAGRLASDPDPPLLSPRFAAPGAPYDEPELRDEALQAALLEAAAGFAAGRPRVLELLAAQEREGPGGAWRPALRALLEDALVRNEHSGQVHPIGRVDFESSVASCRAFSGPRAPRTTLVEYYEAKGRKAEEEERARGLEPRPRPRLRFPRSPPLRESEAGSDARIAPELCAVHTGITASMHDGAAWLLDGLHVLLQRSAAAAAVRRVRGMLGMGERPFARPDLLAAAMRHSSARAEAPAPAGGAPAAAPGAEADSERLEFLGDRLVAYVVRRALVLGLPRLSAHAAAALSHELCRNATLARAAAALGLDEALERGRGQVAASEKMRADALEALAGALFLSEGLPAARRFLLAALLAPYEELDPRAPHAHKVSALARRALAAAPDAPLPSPALPAFAPAGGPGASEAELQAAEFVEQTVGHAFRDRGRLLEALRGGPAAARLAALGQPALELCAAVHLFGSHRGEAPGGLQDLMRVAVQAAPIRARCAQTLLLPGALAAARKGLGTPEASAEGARLADPRAVYEEGAGQGELVGALAALAGALACEGEPSLSAPPPACAHCACDLPGHLFHKLLAWIHQGRLDPGEENRAAREAHMQEPIEGWQAAGMSPFGAYVPPYELPTEAEAREAQAAAEEARRAAARVRFVPATGSGSSSAGAGAGAGGGTRGAAAAPTGANATPLGPARPRPPLRRRLRLRYGARPVGRGGDAGGGAGGGAAGGRPAQRGPQGRLPPPAQAAPKYAAAAAGLRRALRECGGAGPCGRRRGAGRHLVNAALTGVRGGLVPQAEAWAREAVAVYEGLPAGGARGGRGGPGGARLQGLAAAAAGRAAALRPEDGDAAALARRLAAAAAAAGAFR
eukprot:tig00000093_g3555.t1